MKYSVVIPIHNEEDSVLPLYASVSAVMSSLTGDFEIIFVDDGSTDTSVARLNSIEGIPARLVIVCLAGRHGKSGALQAGFDTAEGEIIVTLDGDLQNDPCDIPVLLRRLDEGFDVVCGWRHRRQDPLPKVIASRLANRLRQLMLGEKLHDVWCGFTVFRRTVLQDIRLTGGLHRFFTAIVKKLGYRLCEVKVTHHPRRSGLSKYGIWDRTPETAADLARVLFVDIHRLMSRPNGYVIATVIKK